MNKKGIAALGLSLMMAGTMLTGCGSGDSDGAGKKADAKRVLDKVWNREKEYADYYIQQTGSRFDMCQDSMMRQMYILKNISDITSLFDVKSAKKRMDAVDKYYSIYQSKGGAIYEGQ